MRPARYRPPSSQPWHTRHRPSTPAHTLKATRLSEGVLHNHRGTVEATAKLHLSQRSANMEAEVRQSRWKAQAEAKHN